MVKKCVLWQRVKIVVDSVERKVTKNLQYDHGLGLTEYRTLRLLFNASNSELRMQELADLLGLNQSSVTRLTERLEKKGYTIRDLCPKDKRGVYTVLTVRGRDVQSVAENDYENYIRMALDESDTNEENKEVVRCLRELIS